MRNHRITKPDFRPCSTCRSRSQAPLCLYTLRMISNHLRNLGRLRYLLGGDRPSQTAHLTLSPRPIRAAGEKVNTARVVSHRCLHRSWRSGFQGSYLSCTSCTNIQDQAAVKLHGVFRPVAGNLYLHRYYNFTDSLVETVPRSLRLSCGSELTRQGISLP